MKTVSLFVSWFVFSALSSLGADAAPAGWHFESSGGMPDKLVWQTERGRSYDLWHSEDLSDWAHVEGFPKFGTGGPMEHIFSPGARGFFMIVFGEPVPAGYVFILGGTFTMGSPDGELGRVWVEEQHEVTVSVFMMKKIEVTH